MANNTDKTSKPKSKKQIKCPRCSKGFQNLGSKLTRHLQKHAGYHPFKCGYCDFMPADKEEMSKHNETEHSGQKIKMLVSSFTFPYQKKLFDELLKKIKKDNEKPLSVVERCSLCGEKFYSKVDYKKHLDQIHDVILEDEDDDKRGKKSNITAKTKTTSSKQTSDKTIMTKPAPAKLVPIQKAVKPKPIEKPTADIEANSISEPTPDIQADKFKDYLGEVHKCSLCGFTCNDKFVTKIHTMEAHKDSKVPATVESSTVPEGGKDLTPSDSSEKTTQPDACLSFLDEEFSEVITSVLAYDQEIKELDLNHPKNGPSLLERAVRDNFCTKGRKKYDRPEDWVCPDCNRQNFNNLASFVRHLRCHAVYRPYGCNYCVFTSSDSGEIKRHTDNKHPGKLHELKIIDDAIIPKAKYLNSLLAFQKLNIKTNLISIECFYICRICYAFGTFLKSQFMQHQKKCLMYKSKYGDKFESMIQTQDKASDFDDEMDTSQPFEDFDKIFKDGFMSEPNQVSNTTKTTNVSKKPSKACTICSFKTDSPKLLVDHILSAHPKSKATTKTSCNHCGLTFNNKTVLKQHKCIKVGKNFIVMCTVCDDKIDIKELKSHFENHKVLAKLASLIACPACKISFKWNTIITHITDHFVVREDLLKRATESTEFVSLVECLICKEKVQFDSLESHLLLHSKSSENKSRSSQGRPSKKFKSYRELYPPESPTTFIPLETDEESVSSSNDFYVCHLCEQSVPLCAKVSHIKLHKGVFKFRCKYCRYKKVCESTVRNHVRKIHKGQPEELLKMSPNEWMQTDVLIQSSIQEHLSDVKLITKLQCVFCQEEFSDYAELNKHKAEHSLQPSEVKRCRLCRKCFEGEPAVMTCRGTKKHILEDRKVLYPLTGRCENGTFKYDSVFVSDKINIGEMESTVEVKHLFN